MFCRKIAALVVSGVIVILLPALIQAASPNHQSTAYSISTEGLLQDCQSNKSNFIPQGKVQDNSSFFTSAEKAAWQIVRQYVTSILPLVADVREQYLEHIENVLAAHGTHQEDSDNNIHKLLQIVTDSSIDQQIASVVAAHLAHTKDADGADQTSSTAAYIKMLAACSDYVKEAFPVDQAQPMVNAVVNLSNILHVLQMPDDALKGTGNGYLQIALLVFNLLDAELNQQADKAIPENIERTFKALLTWINAQRNKSEAKDNNNYLYKNVASSLQTIYTGTVDTTLQVVSKEMNTKLNSQKNIILLSDFLIKNKYSSMVQAGALKKLAKALTKFEKRSFHVFNTGLDWNQKKINNTSEDSLLYSSQIYIYRNSRSDFHIGLLNSTIRWTVHSPEQAAYLLGLYHYMIIKAVTPQQTERIVQLAFSGAAGAGLVCYSTTCLAKCFEADFSFKSQLALVVTASLLGGYANVRTGFMKKWPSADRCRLIAAIGGFLPFIHQIITPTDAP